MIDAEFFTKLFLLQTVDRTDFDHAIKALRNRDVFLLERLALLKLGVKEVYDPNFLPTVELEYFAEVELHNI